MNYNEIKVSITSINRSLMVFALALLIACNQRDGGQNTSNTVRLTGKIENLEGDTVRLRTGHERMVRMWDIEHKTPLRADNTFEIIIDIKDPAYYTLGLAKELYLSPGDDLKLDVKFVNPYKLESLQVEGKGSLANIFLFERRKIISEMWWDSSTFSLPLPDYVKHIDEKHKKLHSMLDHYEQKGIPTEFAQTQRQDLKYLRIFNLLSYPERHEMYAGRAPKIGDDYYSFLEDYDFNKANLLKVGGSYMTTLNRVVTHMLEQDKSYRIADFRSKCEREIDFAASNIENKDVKNYVVTKIFFRAMMLGSMFDAEYLLPKYFKHSNNKKNQDYFQNSYGGLAYLRPGRPAPGWEYENVEGKVVSLTDLRGKYVYIDVWATWCGPCKREIPHLEKLEEQYGDNPNFAFVSISVDNYDDRDKWKKMVVEKNMKGLQLLADRAFDSDITNDYKIDGIPGFILIDKEGMIIDVEAPRPSSDEIKTIFAELAKS